MENSLSASVVITTKNRCSELRNALNSCLIQEPIVEVVVVDDGSNDETSRVVSAEFPTAKLCRNETSIGLVGARNRGAREAKGDIIFSIDDDAIFTTPHIVADILKEFHDQRIGAVAIPYVDINKSPAVRQAAPSDDGIWLTDRFIGTAHAVRRELFVQLGGYRDYYVHQGEERDFCLRLMEAQYYVCLGSSDVIHHFESPKRDISRMDYYGRRNDVLFVWLNLHWSILPFYLIGTSIKGLIFGLRVRRPIPMIKGLLAGYRAILYHWRDRVAVKVKTYQDFRKLQRLKYLSINDIVDN